LFIMQKIFCFALFLFTFLLSATAGAESNDRSALPERLLQHPDWPEWKEQLGEFRSRVNLRSLEVFLFTQGRVTLPARADRPPVLTLAQDEEAALERALASSTAWNATLSEAEATRSQVLARSGPPLSIVNPPLFRDNTAQPRPFDLSEIRLVRDWDGTFHLGTADGQNFLPFRPLGEVSLRPLNFQQDTRPVLIFRD
jgi:hypothetical protein